MKCSNCQSENPQGARFCTNCGTQFPQKCSNCATTLKEAARFCHNCGHPVSADTSSSQPTPASPTSPTSTEQLIQRYLPKELLAKLENARASHLMSGERRVVTILFCDVQGSTAAAARLDPEEWAEIINGAFKHMIQPIYQYEGTVARLQGDGILAFFGAPIAHEDDPERAVLAGLQIIQALTPYREGVSRQWGIDLSVRVGINTGLVVVGEVGSDLRVEYTALGDAINLAARMEQNAFPGTVLVAETTYRLVAPLFEVDMVEGLEIKGYSEPLTAYRPVRRKEQPGSLRGLAGLSAPLIGREQQMQVLWSGYEQLKQGRGQIISVIGEAGLGKSRLIDEFSQALQAKDPTVQWLEGHTRSYQSNLPFAPFIDLLARFFNQQPGTSQSITYPQILNRLETWYGARAGETAPFFGHLLGIPLDDQAAERIQYIPPQRLRGTLFAHITALLEYLLKSSPLILFLDDLHWSDPTSIELLQSLLELSERAPLMITTAFRPRRSEPFWEFHTQAERAHSPRYHALNLQPLSEAQSRQLVSNLLQIEELPEKVRLKILEKSEGNPFFVEEIIRSLLDGGLIVQENDHWYATSEINTLSVPDTLIGVITARLDRLPDETRRTLQAAAVLGREFSAEILREIVQIDAENLEDHLAELQRRDLVREISPLPQRLFSFKHGLTQEAAYHAVLLSNRRELHRLAAEAILSSTPNAAAEISHHLIEARQAARAVPYLIQAGDQSNLTHATEEAVSFFQQALDIKATEDPATLTRIYEGLGRALTDANRIPEALAIYQEMKAQAEASGSIPMQISALNKLASVTALNLGQFQEAELLLNQAEQLSHAHNDKSGIPDINLLHCLMCTAQADFENVVIYMDEVINIGHELDNQEFVATGLEHVATSLVYLTRFDQAEERGQQALQAARKLGDRVHEANMLCEPLPLIAFHQGDFQQAEAYLQLGLEISNRIDYVEGKALSAYLLGELARWRGDYQAALQYSQQAMAAALPLEAYLPFLLAPVLGSVGMIYLEISPQFHDKTLEFHQHALRLLETPLGIMTAGLPWSDLALCAVMTGDLALADTVIAASLNTPNTYSLIERPRQLAAAAQLAGARGDWNRAVTLANEARSHAEDRLIRQHYPLTALVQGQAYAGAGQLEQAFQALDKARQEAQAFGMQPVAWQVYRLTAQVLEKLGQQQEADQARAAASRVINEIADRFEDQELRQIYLLQHE
jgi:class 3 adenylate cyclase/tetratricopeptide (TPR) repeat protein